MKFIARQEVRSVATGNVEQRVQFINQATGKLQRYMRLDLCSNGGTCFDLPGRSNHQSCQSIPQPLLCSRSLGHRSLQFGPARQRNLSSRKTTPHAGGGAARGVGPTDARTDQSSRVGMPPGTRKPMGFSPLGCEHRLNSIPAGFLMG